MQIKKIPQVYTITCKDEMVIEFPDEPTITFVLYHPNHFQEHITATHEEIKNDPTIRELVLNEHEQALEHRMAFGYLIDGLRSEGIEDAADIVAKLVEKGFIVINQIEYNAVSKNMYFFNGRESS